LTNERRWNEVDSYFAKTLIGSDPALDEALAANAAAGLPSIDVPAPQGKLIHLLARMSGARKALEIGTLGGFRPSGSRAPCLMTAGSSRSK
jgi:predicted O-methyltransferase YrrM